MTELINALEGLKMYLHDMNKAYLYIFEKINDMVSEQYDVIKTVKTGVQFDGDNIQKLSLISRVSESKKYGPSSLKLKITG